MIEIKKFDTGFMDSIINLWKKYALVGKSFLSNLILSIEKNIAQKFATINIMVEERGSNISWLNIILPLLKEDINLGILVWIWEKKPLIGKAITLVMTHFMIGYKQNLENQKCVKYVEQQQRKDMIGQIKVASTNVIYQTGNVFA
jgi:hypothetical protein